jgi:hypothetical protein
MAMAALPFRFALYETAETMAILSFVKNAGIGAGRVNWLNLSATRRPRRA